MSLSAREWQALHSIESQLADSDPDLDAMLTTFAGTAGGDGMPPTERGRTGWRRVVVALTTWLASPYSDGTDSYWRALP